LGPLPPSSSLALRGSHAAMSKARMLDLFQRMAAASSGGGGGEAALFHGLRVRMVRRALEGRVAWCWLRCW
jgi:hypothetical protein